MTEKELRKLSRSELLEMLVTMTEENDALRKKLSAAQEKLNDRAIKFDKVGSLAEASLELNKVFQAADEAALQYLQSIRRYCADQETKFRHLEEDAQLRANAIIANAEEEARKRMEEADLYWEQVMKKSHYLHFEQHMLQGEPSLGDMDL